MPTARELFQDPGFQALPLEGRRQRLKQADPKFAAFPPEQQDKILNLASQKFQSRSAPPPPARNESLPQRVGADISLGFRQGVGELAQTGANVLHMIPGASGLETSVSEFAKRETPKPAESAGRTGILDLVAQGAGSALPTVAKYAPAMLARRYAPVAAGVTGAISKLHEGPEAMVKEGIKDLVGFGAMDVAGEIPGRVARAGASAAAQAVPTAIETGGDVKATTAAAIMGGTIGGVTKAKPSYTKEQAAKLLKGGMDAFDAAADQVKKNLAPQTRSASAGQTARSMRAHLAEVRQSSDIADYGYKEARKSLDKLPTIKPADFVQQVQAGQRTVNRFQFIDDIEEGRKQLDPKLQTFADTMRKMTDDKRDQVNRETGALSKYYEDYFPHIWKDPTKAQQFVQNFYAGKRPLSGPRGFLKQRTHPTFADGLAAGLEPVTENAADLLLLKYREMDRFLMANRVVKDLDQAGVGQWIPFWQQHPPRGFVKVNDAAFSGYKFGAKGGQIKESFYLPDTAAQVINNYLSPGLRGHQWYRGIREMNNMLNNIQLGLSAFHAGFTSVDSMISRFGIGTERVVEGVRSGKPAMVAKGIGQMATAPIAPMSNAIKGFNVKKEWMKPGSTTPENASVVQMMKEAGASVQIDPIYRTRFNDRMQQAFREKKMLKGAAMVLPAGVDFFGSMLMNHFVPWQKIGVFSDMARFELERLPANAPLDQIRSVMGKAWDSVDNRMGQLVYDNLFWNKMATDSAMLLTRSVGWNLGTFREILGGAGDWAAAIGKVATGKPAQAEFTHRMAYTLSLPIMTGMMGGLATYMMTGEPPKELKDYIFPRTGRKDEFGRDERLSLPSYMKDIYHWYTKPGQTAKSKLSPLVWTITEMLNNEDFYRQKIHNEDDPLFKQVVDWMEFIGTQATPLSFRNISKEMKAGYPAGQQVAAAFGVVPAPADVKKSKAENAIDKILQEKLPQGAQTKEQVEKRATVREIEHRIRTGTDPAPIIIQGMEEGKIGEQELKTAIARASSNPLERGFEGLSLEDALKVYDLATKEERKRLLPILVKHSQRHIQDLAKIPPQRRKAVARKFMQYLESSGGTQ